MMDKSIFEKIAEGSIPAKIFWQNDKFMAFLDISPFRPGHSLVVPKKNLGDYIFDLEETDYLELMQAVKEVADYMKLKLECSRIFTWVQGLEVPHVHVHLIPGDSALSLDEIADSKGAAVDLDAIFEKLKDE